MSILDQFLRNLEYDEKSFVCEIEGSNFYIASNVDGYAEDDGDFIAYQRAEEIGSIFDKY